MVARLRPHAPAARFSAVDFPLYSDADMLEQILLNLLRNATEAGTEVVVEAEPGRICVTDNGPGLPPEVSKRLFQPFFTTKAQGTGLGLAIAHNLARALNAQLTIGTARPAGTFAELRWTPSPRQES
jgi:signal transduction histidine kinase